MSSPITSPATSTEKTVPFTKAQIDEIRKTHPTPFYLYDEAAIRANVRALNEAFSWCPGFREYFAVKATPNPRLLQILMEEGCGADCSSLGELLLCERVGMTGEKVMFTSNNTLAKDYQKARDLGAVINLDDLTHVEYLDENVGTPDLICFRYNPGPLREGNVIIGKPEEAKFGFTREQLFTGYRQALEKGATRFGLHTMVASNELNPEFFVETAVMLFELAIDLHKELGIKLEFVNLGGGMGIPYRPGEIALDYEVIGSGVKAAYDRLIGGTELDPLTIYLENGRIITGPYGYLVTEVVHAKNTYKNYVGVDACMANLMRPGMYGSYHHMSILGKESAPHDLKADVVGSLCENNDKFAIDRQLPQVERGDVMIIHDAGAHGHSMGFQYNAKLRSAELLLGADGNVELIRRAETMDDYFATLNF
ncbi:diaminopimelate decarboxylase [Rubripirellula reticaptiva]|uniref:Diaminopimelate decarboxylase n=1 Tax=Rubripirellula reticaptiva TaxID=2528013 RepID=A0A5C6EIZ8_9BACT|nr:diaminopimelate decarboxylase [Rubripirellula reticaptiva]TWU48450.1 Diaminopimelate decarboxylase [Rubripirellula reticaptiva]